MASADHPSTLIAERVELTQRVGHGAGGGQRVAPRIVGVAGGGVYLRHTPPLNFNPSLDTKGSLLSQASPPLHTSRC